MAKLVPVLIPLGATGRTSSLGFGWRPLKPPSAAMRNEDRWLAVSAHIRVDEGQWAFVDESLMESEALALINWLRHRPWPDLANLRFIEPCLEFQARGSIDGLLSLAITFRGEASPPWIRGNPDAVWSTGFNAKWLIDDQQLAKFADGLHDLLARSRPKWR